MDNLDTSLWPDLPAQEKDRVIFATVVLNGTPPAAAAQQLGHSHNYPQRVAEHLAKYGTFAEATHHKERTKFTDEVLEGALQHLLNNAESAFTTADLVRDLQQASML